MFSLPLRTLCLFLVRWRAQFVKNWNKPSTDIDDLPTPPPLPPSFDDIPDIDTADDSFTPTMYISPDYANELGVPQKPLRRF